MAEGKFGAIGYWFDADDQALVTLRATLKSIETEEGTLILPMVHRNELAGVVVVGHKRSRDA